MTAVLSSAILLADYALGLDEKECAVEMHGRIHVERNRIGCCYIKRIFRVA